MTVTRNDKPRRRQVVIIGSGFGGLFAAQRLKKADCDVTLIAKTTSHLFQPMLYQVAGAALNPSDIASPIRSDSFPQSFPVEERF